MSPKNHSLAFDEAVKEFDNDHRDFEPELKVIVNAHYGKTPAVSDDIIQITGRITVSF